MAEIKLIGFAPDLDPATPGIIIDGDRFVPSKAGIRPMKAPFPIGLPALSSECRGAAIIENLDETRNFYAGTQTKLYEAAGSAAWVDVSKAGDYAGNSESRWRFEQFGDIAYAVNGVDPMQYFNTGTNKFADRGGDAPIAKIIQSAWPGFLMVFNYNDGVNDYQDGWYCCALNNPSDWTPSIATQSAKGRLTDTPGPIRAGRKLGQNIIAYKQNSIYIGTYIGPPLIWEWQLLPGEVGAVSQEAVINIDTAHIFAGENNFYYFDGTRPVPIGNPLKDWYNLNVTETYKYKIQSLHDRKNSNAYFFYADGDGVIRAGLVYNYLADKWGKTSLYEGKSLQAAVDYLSGVGYTYDNIGDSFVTYDDLPEIPYDSPFWTANTTVPAIFQNDNKLYSLTGTPPDDPGAETNIVVNYSGDDDIFSLIQRIRLDFVSKNLSLAQLNLRTADFVGDDPTIYGPFSINGNKFDVLRSAKWISPQFVFRGDFEITKYKIQAEPEGEE